MKQLFLLLFTLSISHLCQSQQSPKVDFKKLSAEVKVIPSGKKVEGTLNFVFDVLSPTDSIYIDAQKMEIEGVLLNNEEVDFENDGKRLWLISDFSSSQGNILEFKYSTKPDQTMYFIGWNNPPGSEYEPQVWTQGQGKYTSHWLPSFDDATEKLEFDLTFLFPEGMEVISNGKLQDRSAEGENLMRWEFDMEKPMSSYLVAVAAGDYYREEISSSSGVPIYNYFYPGDEEKVEPTYRYTRKIFDFLEEEIGFPYPWQVYKQVPVQDFLYSGMENTGATIFSDIFVIDSIGFIDRNYIMVNAHEMAHQWFGNTVTAASGKHHWLQEGFATYYALLAEREIHGEDYYYWNLYQTAEQLKALSDQGKGESLMNPNSGSVTFYNKGAWALHILRERIGNEPFKAGVKNYLEKYKFSSATVEQFIEEMEAASGKDLSDFISQWLKQTAFPGTEAFASLKNSEFINRYLSIAALKSLPLQDKKALLNAALGFPVNDYIGQEVVHQLALEEPEEVLELYKKAFESNNLMVRQAIALSLSQVPQDLKRDYESLLQDDTYLTMEAALYNLWMSFPEDRKKYLDQLKGTEGFADKNIRTLWLALSLATPDYEEEKQAATYKELSRYTSPEHPYLLRQNAFKYLFQLNSFTDQNLQDLVQGSQHYIGRFRSFSREMITQLLQNPSYLERFLSLKGNLPEKQQAYLERVIEDN